MTAETTNRDFFTGLVQAPIRVRQFNAKAPLFYRDLEFMGAVYAVPLKRLFPLLSTEADLQPLSPFPGYGLLAIHCLDFRDTDIGPYREVALSVVVRSPDRIPSMLQMGRSFWSNDFHAYILHLPVNTEVALTGGVDFFNFPKGLFEIEFRQTANHRICTVRDLNTKDVALEFGGRRINARNNRRPKSGSQEMTVHSYPKLAGQRLHAKFKLNLIDLRRQYLSQCSTVHFGKTSPFQDTKSTQPWIELQYDYCIQAQGILYLPEQIK